MTYEGSSFDHVAKLMSEADPAFPARMSTGLSSGEGLIWTLRDPAGQDPGNPDKRLLVLEPEFAALTGISTVTRSLILVLASGAESGMAVSLNAWAGGSSAGAKRSRCL